MAEPLPIACTLNGDDVRERAAQIRALGAAGLVSSDTHGARAVLRFRADSEIRRRVEAIAAAESRCCAFLDFDVEHGDSETVLTITGSDEAAEAVSLLASTFGGSLTPARP